jgi:signal peptidase II
MITGCNADLHTKQMAMNTIKENQTVTIVNGFMELSYRKNIGMVFGVLSNKESIVKHYLLTGLTFSSILFIFYIIWYFRKLSFFYHLPFFLILSGALGNVIDRIRFGHVIDFIHIHWRNTLDWPFVFNIADVFICSGEVLLLVTIIMKRDTFKKVLRPQIKNAEPIKQTS